MDELGVGGALFRTAHHDHRGPQATLRFAPISFQRHFESCLGSLNKGELITENVRLCKGRLSLGCRGSSGLWQSPGELWGSLCGQKQ